MRQFVTKYVRACLNCAYYKHTAGKHQYKLNTIEKVPTPFHLFGVPNRIISDRGIAYISQAFRMAFCVSYGIKHVLNAIATPQANGQCERYNKTIVQALATIMAGRDPRRWDAVVKQIQGALNTYNKSINTTRPYRLRNEECDRSDALVSNSGRSTSIRFGGTTHRHQQTYRPAVGRTV